MRRSLCVALGLSLVVGGMASRLRAPVGAGADQTLKPIELNVVAEPNEGHPEAHTFQAPYVAERSHPKGAHVGPRYVEFPKVVIKPEEDAESGFRPAYVRPGFFEERMKYEAALARAQQEAHDQALRSVAERGACRLCRAAIAMGRVLVDEERGLENAQNLITVTRTTCPIMVAKYGKFVPWLDCEELENRVAHYYDPRFEGAVPGHNETRKVNFALVHLLQDCRTYMRLPFCPKDGETEQARWKHWAHYMATNPYQQELSKEERKYSERMAKLHQEMMDAKEDATPREEGEEEITPADPAATLMTEPIIEGEGAAQPSDAATASAGSDSTEVIAETQAAIGEPEQDATGTDQQPAPASAEELEQREKDLKARERTETERELAEEVRESRLRQHEAEIAKREKAVEEAEKKLQESAATAGAGEASSVNAEVDEEEAPQQQQAVDAEQAAAELAATPEEQQVEAATAAEATPVEEAATPEPVEAPAVEEPAATPEPVVEEAAPAATATQSPDEALAQEEAALQAEEAQLAEDEAATAAGAIEAATAAAESVEGDALPTTEQAEALPEAEAVPEAATAAAEAVPEAEEAFAEAATAAEAAELEAEAVPEAEEAVAVAATAAEATELEAEAVPEAEEAVAEAATAAEAAELESEAVPEAEEAVPEAEEPVAATATAEQAAATPEAVPEGMDAQAVPAEAEQGV